MSLLRSLFSEFLSSHPDFISGGNRVRELKKFVQIDSVDGFQGAEKDIILISLVRSSQDENSSIGFLSDYRRMNVAITRPKYMLLFVGNATTLRGDSNWGALINHYKAHSALSEVKQYDAFKMEDNYTSFHSKIPLTSNLTILRKTYKETGDE